MAVKKKVDSKISNYLSSIGRKGAKASNKTRTPDQRRRAARKAAQARWKTGSA